jgi:hypothetical protein
MTTNPEYINQLAAIIREVDGARMIASAAELAEAILSHPASPLLAPMLPTAPPTLPANYIDREHQGEDLELLKTFYQACSAEGGTADEIHLRGLRAVLAARPTALAQPEGEGPSAADLLPANPPNIFTTMAMQYRSAWREGVEDGWNEARAALARWGRPATSPALEASNFDPRLIALATTSEQIPPGPYSEHELRTQWDAQADEHNQWGSLDSSEQLAWAQARAIAADRNGRPATPPAQGPAPDKPAESLAARRLLEKLARLDDSVGITVAEVRQLADHAAAWLRETPPGQPVAIESRGCPTPGACSCVVPAALPAPEVGEVGELVALLKIAGRWATSTGVHLDRFAALFDDGSCAGGT